MIYLADHLLGVEYDTKNPIVITDGSTSDTNRNHSTARGYITRDTLLPHKQGTALKLKTQDVSWENFIQLSSSTAISTGRVRL